MLLKVGEVRQVGFEFRSSDGNSFIIDGADYVITDQSDAIMQSGNAEIDNLKVLTIFNANTVGTFYVTFTVHIGSEIYRPQKVIKVEEI